MSDDTYRLLVAVFNSLPDNPTHAQIVAAREAFGRLLDNYHPETPEERAAIDDMADALTHIDVSDDDQL